MPLPSQAELSGKHLRTAAADEAAAWFLQRGYVAAVPLAVAQYDLITDSGQGFKRIQVKTTTAKDRSGRWRVPINRFVDEPGGATQNEARAHRAYRPDEGWTGSSSLLAPVSST